MIPGRSLRKAAPPAAPAGREAECALELIRIGDRWNLRQRLLNLLAKLLSPIPERMAELLQQIQWITTTEGLHGNDPSH